MKQKEVGTSILRADGGKLDLSGNLDAQEQMVQGSVWMTAGSIFSRILGAIYIIPWVTWLGAYSDQANALFSKGYNIYSLFLMAATAGIPAAVSKLVSHYNELNEYGVGRRLYKHGMLVSAFTGLISAMILFFGAPLLANGDANVVPVLRSLAVAVLVIPGMSLSRGLFQGYHQMAPSAISQFNEQLFRVIYMLVSTYVIMKIMHGSWKTAVVHSTFAAFIGAIGGIIILGYYWLKNRKQMNDLRDNSNDELVISSWTLIKDIIIQAIPFVIVSSGTIIFQLIDQYTFFDAMQRVGSYSMWQLNQLWALFSFNANKLIMIVISLASAMSEAVIPLLSAARARKDNRDIRNQISNALMLFYFVMIPAALGLAAVSTPIYTVFYRYSASGSTILEISAYVAIFMGLFTIVAAIMQGVSENTKTLKMLGIGLLVKLVLQYPMIFMFKTIGPLLSTGVGMAVTSYLIIHSLNNEFHIPFIKMFKTINQILLYSIITYAVAKLIVTLLYFVIYPSGRVTAALVLIPAVAGGGLVYVYLVLKSRLAQMLLGPRMDSLRIKLHIK